MEENMSKIVLFIFCKELLKKEMHVPMARYTSIKKGKSLSKKINIELKTLDIN